MRKMIAVAAILAVTSAHAAEELKFGDINYFLKEGQVSISADVNQSYDKNKYNSTTLETRGVIFSTQFAYAFNDQFNSFIGLDYAYDRETEDKTTGSNADVYNDGLSNPFIGANYRLMNQNDNSYNVDFGAIARINIQDAERGDSVGQNSKDGNFADSRSSLELNARMGRKFDIANEWQLAAGAVYFTEGETTLKSIAGETELDDDSSFDLFVRAAYQYRPVNEFMMSISAQATQVGETESDVKNGGKIESDSHLDLDFRFNVKYLITDNFIARLNYGMSRNADFDIKDQGSNEELKNRRENFFGLGVDFLF